MGQGSFASTAGRSYFNAFTGVKSSVIAPNVRINCWLFFLQRNRDNLLKPNLHVFRLLNRFFLSNNFPEYALQIFRH